MGGARTARLCFLVKGCVAFFGFLLFSSSFFVFLSSFSLLELEQQRCRSKADRLLKEEEPIVPGLFVCLIFVRGVCRYAPPAVNRVEVQFVQFGSMGPADASL